MHLADRPEKFFARKISYGDEQRTTTRRIWKSSRLDSFQKKSAAARRSKPLVS
jgi:hypothetical protein